MMMSIQFLLAVLVGYGLGAIPFGVVWVKLFTGQDVRTVGSGRTGGTNAMRAAGFGVGLLTALSDIFKGTLAVWLAHWLLPTSPWAAVLAGLAVIVGHNYSVFLKFKGGAGGATCVGAAIGFWPGMAFIIVPVGAAMLYFVGYASVATMTAALTVTVVLAYLAYGAQVLDPVLIWYGIGSIVLLGWALRPNWARLLRGEERLIGLRAKLKAKREAG